MALTFQKEPFWDALADGKHLLPRHFEEIAEDKDIVEVKPDWPRYRVLNDLGNVHVMTARDGSELVGYYVVITDTSLHYSGAKFGYEDLYYLAPEHRWPRAGARLIQATEAMMRELSVDIAIAHCREKHNHGPLFEYLGWRPFERVYAKPLR